MNMSNPVLHGRIQGVITFDINGRVTVGGSLVIPATRRFATSYQRVGLTHSDSAALFSLKAYNHLSFTSHYTRPS